MVGIPTFLLFKSRFETLGTITPQANGSCAKPGIDLT
jgi:hypothetical protein